MEVTMFEIVYECSVTSGHPKKLFSQQPKYPVFCCGREMVKARVQKEPGTIDGAGQGMAKTVASARRTGGTTAGRRSDFVQHKQAQERSLRRLPEKRPRPMGVVHNVTQKH
jgi:hypothetical protein